ncbi:MAG: hypothetical protein GQ537_07355 [Gammaproteobacteria bacterium]|nr:hypothetical protein [Gammaproteobacteria bacterium]
MSMAFVAAMLLMLVGSNLYTFHRLSDESPIAELQFRKTGTQQYEVTIAYGDFCETEVFTLVGDQWRLDAQFLKWQSWANMLGFDSMYRIERLGGRYTDIKSENTRRHIAYRLHPMGLVDLASIVNGYTGYFLPVDTLYGSSVYGEMDADYIYQVFRGQSGLLVRKTRQREVADIGSGLTIDINTACGHKPGVFRRVVDSMVKVVQGPDS